MFSLNLPYCNLVSFPQVLSLVTRKRETISPPLHFLRSCRAKRSHISASFVEVPSASSHRTCLPALLSSLSSLKAFKYFFYSFYVLESCAKYLSWSPTQTKYNGRISSSDQLAVCTWLQHYAFPGKVKMSRQRQWWASQKWASGTWGLEIMPGLRVRELTSDQSDHWTTISPPR